ncbi:MAG: ABC transporter ATP-binding protein [Verrucomicrobia bacterium]|nr:ABC transporter ATP-binding protein [Verrucomicrobiota bacterium]
MSAAVTVRDLRKAYREVEAVAGVSFAVERGEVFGLLGPNGAGKTTTLECLLGLRTPDAGVLELGGVDLRRHPSAARRKIGAVLQSTLLPERITVREAVRLFAALYPDPVPPAELMERFGLAAVAGTRFEGLSGGERQRLALALAFAGRPEVLVLDEPTAGLDPVVRAGLHEEIRRARADGCAVVLSTHYLEEAEALCDRLAILVRGRILAEGAPRALLTAVEERHRLDLEASGPVPEAWSHEIAALERGRCTGNRLLAYTRRPAEAVAELARRLRAAELEVVALSVRQVSLEEAFLRLTDAGAAAGEDAP